MTKPKWTLVTDNLPFVPSIHEETGQLICILGYNDREAVPNALRVGSLITQAPAMATWIQHILKWKLDVGEGTVGIPPGLANEGRAILAKIEVSGDESD